MTAVKSHCLCHSDDVEACLYFTCNFRLLFVELFFL